MLVRTNTKMRNFDLPSDCKYGIAYKYDRLASIYVTQLSKLEICQYIRRYGGKANLTVAWVADPARPKPVNNQLDDSKALNSDAMTGWVASTSEPSALNTKTAVKISP